MAFHDRYTIQFEYRSEDFIGSSWNITYAETSLARWQVAMAKAVVIKAEI